MSYEALVDAINKAIDKEAAMTNNEFVTNERNVQAVEETLDYDVLMNEFNDLAGAFMAKDAEYYQPRITHIIEKYLGKGKRISDSTIEQVEIINLIVQDMKDELIS